MSLLLRSENGSGTDVAHGEGQMIVGAAGGFSPPLSSSYPVPPSILTNGDIHGQMVDCKKVSQQVVLGCLDRRSFAAHENQYEIAPAIIHVAQRPRKPETDEYSKRNWRCRNPFTRATSAGP